MNALLLAAEKKFWILDPLYAAFGTALAWFYAVIPSFGVAIILLTVAVSILRMPLVAKQVKSQQEMQRIQPELKRIQAKYKNDPQKRNEEMMKLYKEHSVNPFAGCLPLLLQMPLFIVLYRMILGLGEAEPKHIPQGSDLFQALRASEGKMHSLGMDLGEAAAKIQGVTKLLPYLLLIALVIGTGLFQQRQMTARLPKDAQNSQMAVIGKIFPAFLGVISWTIPAGVVLYFFVSNVWQIGQQAVLFRRKDEQKAAAGRGSDKAAKTKGDEADAVAGDGQAAEGGSAKGGAGAGKAGTGKGAGQRVSGGAGKGGGQKARPGKAAGAKAAGGKAAGGKAAGGKAGKGGKATGGSRARAGGKSQAPKAGRGLFGSRGNGKAASGDGGKAGRKADRRPANTKGGSGSNGRSTPGASGRAQPKGTNPQGRSRKGK